MPNKSPFFLLAFVVVGPFAFLKVCAKTLMRRAYRNRVWLKLISSLISLAMASQMAFAYRHRSTPLWFFSALMSFLLNYWYIIPLILIYVVPWIRKFLVYWFRLVDCLTELIVRPLNKNVRLFLPPIWRFESDRLSWLMKNIRRMLSYGAIGPALFCGYQVYSHLCFGISFNLCIAIGVTIGIVKTIWDILEVIDDDLQTFLFAMIVQYYISPCQYWWNIPLTLIVTVLFFPSLDRLATSQFVGEMVENIKSLHSRTFFETDLIYKEFFSEMINLILTIFFTSDVLRICWSADVQWTIIVSIFLFLPSYLFRYLIRWVSLESNLIFFFFTSYLLTRCTLNSRSNEHFLSKYFLLIMILTCYYALIYPLIYQLIRFSTHRFAQSTGENLKSIRTKINNEITGRTMKYLRIVYVHDGSKTLILHLSNIFIALSVLFLIPIHWLGRIFLATISYLFLGHLLLKYELEILATLIAFGTSVTVGAEIYSRYESSLLLSTTMILISYVSTMVVLFPIGYRFLQMIFVYLPWINVFNGYLTNLFEFIWSYANLFWPHLKKSFAEVTRIIEKSPLNIFGH